MNVTELKFMDSLIYNSNRIADSLERIAKVMEYNQNKTKIANAFSEREQLNQLSIQNSKLIKEIQDYAAKNPVHKEE